jgi:acyl dehydratase
MELNPEFTGTPLREHLCAISDRWTMNYAAAIGDTNTLYFNDERDGGTIAPPLFPVAVTWPIIEHIADYIDADSFPKEVILTQVHYTEHLRIHRPVRPGDALRVNGRIAAILPHRAGTHCVLRFDAMAADGAPVFTEHIGAMMRGVKCIGEGRGAESLPPIAPRPEQGAPLWENRVHIDPMLPFIYDGCTNIYFPIHTSVKFAHMVGLPGIILQGTCTLAIAVRELLARETAGDPRGLESVYCRFTGMVMPGTDISVHCTAREKSPVNTNIFFSVLNAEGKAAISDGCLTIKP